MEIEFFYLPAIAIFASLFLAWVFSGFKSNSGEAFLSNRLCFLLGIVSILSMYFSIAYYSLKLLIWIYNNVTIV